MEDIDPHDDDLALFAEDSEKVKQRRNRNYLELLKV
jgi:hypothetical protein